MSARRPPSEPPEIPGFSYLQLLGSGGFADVFLYEQRMPRRRVAIKVLLRESLTEGARDSFDAEANLMAQLSTHPSIVTIYQADISEDGRPYLAMEYCPKPNLGARYRREKISVAEALRIGIQVAGAVETSHRAGILHRDIKPANILVTEYNRPALTDFGISVALVGGSGSEQESVGMSIPWSPPEVFGATPSSGAAADIYSLGATVYTILAGRSPFEVPGGANGGLELIGRIQTAALSRTGRADVPESLERVLATAMAKREADRYGSALEFARALQKVQLELSMSVTPADVLDEQLAGTDLEEEDEGNTRIRGIVTIDPTAPPPTASRRPATTPPPPLLATPRDPPQTDGLRAERDGSPGGSPAEHTQRRGADAGGREEVPVEETVQREAVVAEADGSHDAPRRRALPFVIGAAVLVALVGAGAIVFALNGGGSPAEQSAVETDRPVEQIDVGNSIVPAPTELAGAPSADGTAVAFSWKNPDPQEGDTFRWALVAGGSVGQEQRVDEAAVTVPTEGAAQVCIQVSLVRSDGKGSDPVAGCTP